MIQRSTLSVTCAVFASAIAAGSSPCLGSAMSAAAVAYQVSIASPAAVAAENGQSYATSGFQLEYVKALPFLPDMASELAPAFGAQEIQLGRIGDEYVAPGAGGGAEAVRFADLVTEGQTASFSQGALEAIAVALSEYAQQELGWQFFIAVDPDDIDPATGEDLRSSARTRLALVVSYDGPSYSIGRFEIAYAPEIADHPGQAPIDEILAGADVRLVPSNQGYVDWRPGVEPVPIRLSDLTDEQVEPYSAGALQAVIESVRDYLTDSGYMAVRVVPADGEVDPAAGLADLREGRASFRLMIITGIVSEIRTLASGERIASEERINNAAHKRILEGSPIKPAGDGERNDLLRRDELDNYLFQLSRHPSRRVDAAVAPAQEWPGVSLDYIVSENNPLLLYVHGSNTGTEDTERWRFRTGIYHSQLTGNDDILGVEYITADLDKNNAVVGSYEAKVLNNDRLRWRVHGSWGEYDASEVGFLGETFTGESWSAGGELIWNFFQDRQLFIDLVGGARYTDIEVDNAFVFVSGQEQFFLPYVGLHLERATEESNTDVALMFEWNMADVTSASVRDMNRLGRLFPDEDWYTLRWDASHAFYLEPVFNRKSWEDFSTAESSTLAHEIALRFRGQYAFNNRLVPQMEQVAGGMYSVRGYPESVAVGDTVLLGTAEYRFHLPRAMGVGEPTKFLGEPFRARPEHLFGQPDWDLILRGFVDVGRTYNSDPLSFESDETLVGAGIGVELLYKRNLNVRLDWGFALEEIEGRVDSGSNRLHLSATILF